jgi:DNA-binding HxlR family transcriptional regulator
MALFDLLGRRWTLRLLWELRDGRVTFRELQARCDGMSSSVLNQRLAELRDASVVRLSGAGGGYELTEEGLALVEALRPLQAWAARWSERT